MIFDRWSTVFKRTFAYRVFKSHHSEINHLYWAHHAAAKGAYSLTAGKEATLSANAVFPDTKKERRREIPLSQWSRDFNDFDNWTRLAAVVAITGYLEVFFKSAIEAACQSCPALMVGGHKDIDGIRLLKSRSRYGFPIEASKVTKGDWGKRISEYRRLFGCVPTELHNNISRLEDIRKLRNCAGHAFGRPLGNIVIGRNLGPETVARVSLTKLKKCLALVEEVAISVDAHLGQNYIGSYEILAAYHFWPGRGYNNKENARAFRKHFNGTYQTGISLEYFQAVMIHYHAIGP